MLLASLCVFGRGMIRIDYDDGTQETSNIPDSDVVIYPWRQPELRVRPRGLSQVQQEQERGGKVAGGGHAGGNARKHRVKTEARPALSPRRRVVAQGRDRSGSGSRRESSASAASTNSNSGSRGASTKTARSRPSLDDDDMEESDDEEVEDESGDDGGQRRWQGDAAADSEGSMEGKRNGRWHQRGAKGASRGRSASQKQGQRKRSGGCNGRNGSAAKRRRNSRDGETPFAYERCRECSRMCINAAFAAGV